MRLETLGVRHMLMAVALFAAPAPLLAKDDPQPSRPIIAVAEFDTGRTGWVPPPGFEKTLAELLGQQLVESGRYRVLDSEYLIRDAEGPRRVPLELLRERAEQAGVQYLVLGSVTTFSRENRQRSVGGGALLLRSFLSARFRAPVPAIGSARTNTTESAITLTIRVIDVRTGEIVTTATGEGTATRDARSILAGGVAFGAPAGGGYSRSVSGAQDAMLEEALQDAMSMAGKQLVAAASRLSGKT